MDTTAIDHLINNPPTPFSDNTVSEPSPISTILSNWPNTPYILPPHIPHDLTAPLLSSLAFLSKFTVNQPERAWNLLSCYFQCRVREGGRERGYGVGEVGLEVGDVEKAIESARRMSVGHWMEGLRTSGGEKDFRKWSSKDEFRANQEREKKEAVDGVQPSGKRKYSVRQEIVGDEEQDDNDGDAKKQHLDDGKQGLSPLTSLPPLPPLSALLEDPAQTPTFPNRTLPPITPSNIRPPLTLTIPPTPSPRPAPRYPQATSIASYQAATHHTSQCRKELEDAEENLNVARMRYADAQRKYGEVKRAVNRLRFV